MDLILVDDSKHFALRHHEYKSPLAERFSSWLPPRLDPTRGWAVPVVDEYDEGQTTSAEDRKGAESPGRKRLK